MGIIRAGTPASDAGEAAPIRRGWTGWFGSIQTGFDRTPEDRGREEGPSLARLDSCIIDRCNYGNGEVTFRNRLGGRRNYSLRPLYSVRDREREYADFYRTLQKDIEANGIKVPILLWHLNGKFYCRYGASRLYIAARLELPTVPVIVCSFDLNPPFEDNLPTPRAVLDALGPIQEVGVFEVSHERIDLHNVVPL